MGLRLNEFHSFYKPLSFLHLVSKYLSIHRCIGELVDEHLLEWLKDMIKGVGEFEEIEIPFKRKNPEIVDEWIRLIEQRISVIESE